MVTFALTRTGSEEATIPLAQFSTLSLYNHMCPNDSAGLRLVTRDSSLASCNTVAEIYGSRPGIGAVVLDGNKVGPTHTLPEGKDDLHFFEGSRLVAKYCFVGSSTGATYTDHLLLSHDDPLVT